MRLLLRKYLIIRVNYPHLSKYKLFVREYESDSKPSVYINSRFITQNEDEVLFRMMTRIDFKKLATSIQNEEPKTIALMLSYLEPSCAEQMIAAFNEELQKEVLFRLSEIEKE